MGGAGLAMSLGYKGAMGDTSIESQHFTSVNVGHTLTLPRKAHPKRLLYVI